MSSLLMLIVTVAVVGLFVWAVTTYVPMPDTLKKVVLVVSIFGVLVYVLQAFGLFGSLGVINVPQLK